MTTSVILIFFFTAFVIQAVLGKEGYLSHTLLKVLWRFEHKTTDNETMSKYFTFSFASKI